jgi:acyl dehydratase
VIRATTVIIVLAATLWSGIAVADEAPISGTVKAVDAAAQTVTVESTVKGKTRQVVVHLKPGAKVVRFIRPTEPGKTGFVEQTAALTDLKPGWIVSIATKHEGDKEVADLVKVVLER